MTDKEREYFLARRQGLLIELGQLENMLGLERSVEPKHRRPLAVIQTEYGEEHIYDERRAKELEMEFKAMGNYFRR